MKSLLTSRFTAWAATLAAVIVGWFVSGDFIEPPAAETAAGELATLLNALFAALLGVLAWCAGVVVRKFTRGNPDDKSSGGSAGSWLPVAMAGIATWGAALGGALLLTSCTPAQIEAFRAVPITIGIEGEHGVYGYSSKSGLSVAVKAPRVREEKSGINVMLILEREWECGRYLPSPLEQWPPIERKPRRLVMPPDEFAEHRPQGHQGQRGSGAEADAGSR